MHSPATGELVGKVPLAAKADVDAACAAARKAFDEGPWPHMSPAGARPRCWAAPSRSWRSAPTS